ncbi:MAG: hypothetical protein ACO3JL_08065 [Myxococcota bacterium]
MTTKEIGEPGWTGQAVRLRRLNDEGEPVTWGMVTLHDDGVTVTCEPAELLTGWERDGILGRAHFGVVYPRDGRRFLDELPFMYKSPYCFAEPCS